MSDALKALEEFKARLHAEFSGQEQRWARTKEEAGAATGADRVFMHRDVLFTTLREGGYLFKLHVGRTRFSQKLRPEDLGLDPQNKEHMAFVERYFHLGRKLLLPAETLKKLDHIEKKMRSVLEKYGIPTCAGMFVPLANVVPLRDEIESLKGEYFAVRDAILHDYDQIKAETAMWYRKQAVEAFRLLRKDPGYVPSEEEIKKFVGAVMSGFPSREAVFNSFYVTLEAGVVETTEFLESQEARLRLIKEREELYRRELALIDRRLREKELVQSERERQLLAVEREKAALELARLEAERRAVAEVVEQKKQEIMPKIEQVFADLAGAVYGIIYDAAHAACRSLELNGSLSASSIRSLKGLAEKVKRLMANPDPAVDAWLAEIDKIVSTAPEHRDFYEVSSAIRSVRAGAAEVIMSLGRLPRTLRSASSVEELSVAFESGPEPPARQQRLLFGGAPFGSTAGTAPVARSPRVLAAACGE